ncbi:MAG: CO dehydrogenase/acetyl-CoA synthase complex subunit epsilon [Candidatus Altiarchaeales archaeon WOR_SM1_86-2]|nr:MAG: CO dehydrogenase/acetyl-CoA synthase complex subunit epsilon [Candidatus Altiarchaeales archaeon WOR_SM1_86-2]
MKIEGKDIKVYVGEVIQEAQKKSFKDAVGGDWEEKMGPTPMPQVSDLRHWDKHLLDRYKPKYHAFIKQCQFCAYGPCDLDKGRRGACGIDLDTQMARESLFLAVTGCAAHSAHGRHQVHYLIEKFGRDLPLNVAENTEVEAPNIRLVCGFKPETLGDLEKAISYVEEQLCHLLSALHMGQECNDFDFNSKALHAGMLDHVGMEVCDIAQITALGFPKGDTGPELTEIGFASVDRSKPVILCIGHNVAGGTEILDYAAEKDYDVEVAGLCCTALDIGRYEPKAKIIGQLSYELPYIRSGIADTIVLDEQCIRVDSIENAKKLGIPVITTSDKNSGGFEDMSHEDADKIVKKLVFGDLPGVYLPDLEKAGEVAVKTAVFMKEKDKDKKREKNDKSDCFTCTDCGLCSKACPVGVDPQLVIRSINKIYNKEYKPKKDDLEFLGQEEILERIGTCVFCGRCESWCPKDIPVVSVYSDIYRESFSKDKAKISPGRGAIQDIEIREVGMPIVFGEIPGVIAPVGCSLWPWGGKVLGEIIEEFLNRNYIVATSGCSAMALATDYSGTHNLYEKYGGRFAAGNLVNVGSCVANSHITGAAIKVANIFAKRKLRANYEEIADYCLNRIGAVGLVLGTYSQKAVSIGNGCMRLGIPVIWGPSGIKYRKELLSDETSDWGVYDSFSGEKFDVGPCPEHLSYVAKTKEDVMIMIPKLCIRASDNFKGRQIKLAHWIDMYRRFSGDGKNALPGDLHRFIRQETDIPMTLKDEILDFLKGKGWKPKKKNPDPTLVRRLCRT